MSRRVIVLFALCFALVTVLALPAFAQDAMPVPPNAIAGGLTNPRFISIDADGNLWIAEAGQGGELTIPADPNAPEGAPGSEAASAGLSGQVSMVAADGTQSVAIPWLFGIATSTEQLGVSAAYSTGDAVWLVMSGGGPGPQPYYGDYVLKLTNVNGFWRVTDSIDMYANEAANNPDGADPLDSNVNSLAWDANGTLYVVDTGANTVFTWTEADGLSVWHSWNDDPVPTALDFAEDGTAYVGFLGTGIAPGAGHIEHISADGSEVLETFGGLTAVTDVAVGQDGNVYAVELVSVFGEQGPDMMSGAVVMVNADGATPVAEGLFMPYSLAQAADGSWAVSIGTLAGPGNGAVIKLGGEMQESSSQSELPAELVGSWTVTVTKDDLVRVVPDFPQEYQCDNAGTFVWNLKADGTFTVDQTALEGCQTLAQTHIESTWSSSGNLITLAEGTPDQEVYQWTVDGDQLTLEYQSGNCPPCQAVNTANPWTRS